MSRPITPQRQKNLDEQLAKMVVWDLQPFSFVEDRGFKAFTKALNPFYTLPGRKTVSKVLVPRLYASCHAGVKERMGHAAAVCLTTDCWTSRTTQSYMSVTCHFLENYEMVSCLLDCFQFSDRHTADNLSGHLLRIAREWEIQEGHGGRLRYRWIVKYHLGDSEMPMEAPALFCPYTEFDCKGVGVEKAVRYSG